jgi:hypothetical protein
MSCYLESVKANRKLAVYITHLLSQSENKYRPKAIGKTISSFSLLKIVNILLFYYYYYWLGVHTVFKNIKISSRIVDNSLACPQNYKICQNIKYLKV